jgi:hypothetical protein
LGCWFADESNAGGVVVFERRREGNGDGGAEESMVE